MPLKIGDHDSGVRIEDLFDAEEFLSRPRKPDVPGRLSAAMPRLRQRASEGCEGALDELMQIGLDYCGADSAGISLEEVNAEGELQFRWIAVAGSFNRYLNGITPRFYSPCGTCLDRGVAQHYQVFNPYYNFLGVDAEPILDGLLIPWRNGKSQGTIWLASHSSEHAFDMNDFEFMLALGNFVAETTGASVRGERLRKPVQPERPAAAAAMTPRQAGPQ